MNFNRLMLRHLKTTFFINRLFDGNMTVQHEHKMYYDMQKDPELYHNFMMRQEIEKALGKLDFARLNKLIDTYKQDFLVNYNDDDEFDNNFLQELVDTINGKAEVLKDEKVCKDIVLGLLREKHVRDSRENQVAEVKSLLSVLFNPRIIKETINNSTQVEKKANKKGIVRRHALTTFLVVIISFGAFKILVPSSYSNEELFAKYYELPSSQFFSRNDKDLVEFTKLYKQGNYTKAYSQICDYPNDINEPITLYKGILAMQIGRFDEARQHFEFLISNNKNCQFHSLSNWYLGLTYIKLNEVEKAKEAFGKVIVQDISKHREIIRILKKLSS